MKKKFSMKIFILVPTSAVLIISAAAASNSELDSIVKKAWLNLGESKSVCGDYDYFPEGGMRNFACHLGHFISFKKFQKLIGVPVYLKGPHQAGELDLNSQTDFGRYNPAFVKKLRKVMIPAVKDKKFLKATERNYTRFISPIARIYYVTYKKIHAHPVFINIEKTEYLAAVAGGRNYDHEPFFFFMNPEFFTRPDTDYLFTNGFDGGYSGNVVKTAVAFWIRRNIDGTAEEFFKGLSLLVDTYDPEFKKNADRAVWD
jgi:hypothetical protein